MSQTIGDVVVRKLEERGLTSTPSADGREVVKFEGQIASWVFAPGVPMWKLPPALYWSIGGFEQGIQNPTEADAEHVADRIHHAVTKQWAK